VWVEWMAAVVGLGWPLVPLVGAFACDKKAGWLSALYVSVSTRHCLSVCYMVRQMPWRESIGCQSTFWLVVSGLSIGDGCRTGMLRSYHPEHTGSHQNSEVKLDWAGLVLC
jgi:hypothetical protein